MRSASRYDVSFAEGEPDVVVEIRPAHWLKLERQLAKESIEAGQLEQLLRVLQIAHGDEGDFETWADSLLHWTPSAREVPADPSLEVPQPSSQG